MANEKRLIDANVAIERAKASNKIVGSSIWETGEVVEFLEDCPIVDAVEVVHSKWAKDGDGDEYCENCSRYMPIREVTGDPSAHNYCPNCGAKMDGERKDTG